ncbi:MAG TPA: DUF3592 domain-containing protein [Pseudonocardiaceae bacterium]
MRHGALATALVLAACAAIGGLSLASYRQATDTLHVLTARATGTVTGASTAGAVVEWTAPTGKQRLTVPLTGTIPPRGTRTQIAYNPANPAQAIIPGAAILTDADRSRDGVLFAALVAALALLTDGWLLATRRRVARQPPRDLVVRRISMRRGLMARTWLETDDQRWIPVYFDPAVLSLPAPTTVQARGNRLIAVEIPGATLYPSGRARRAEPPGRRTDSPAQPDTYTAARAATAARWRHQLRVDAALLVPAPLIGLLWTYLDDSGLTGWLGATAITAAATLWWAALRGSDPS